METDIGSEPLSKGFEKIQIPSREFRENRYCKVVSILLLSRQKRSRHTSSLESSNIYYQLLLRFVERHPKI